MNASEFINDIPRSVAYASRAGISFVPEKRAEQIRNEYAESMARDYAELAKLVRDESEAATLAEEFARYREGYRRRELAYLHSSSRLVSVMIAGPPNFPAARMNKRGDVAHKRLTEVVEYRHRALAAIRRKLRPEKMAIMSGDADAVEHMEAKIREAERLQDAMRKANVIVRQKPKHEATPEKLAALMEMGFSERRARELFTPDFCHRYGFADYELKNNGANIRRMAARLEELKRAKAAPEVEVQGEFARAEDSPADNRIRLFFPGKPASDVREGLKRNGFRWAPSLGCWQAYRNSRSLEAARQFAGIPAVKGVQS